MDTAASAAASKAGGSLPTSATSTSNSAEKTKSESKSGNGRTGPSTAAEKTESKAMKSDKTESDKDPKKEEFKYPSVISLQEEIKCPVCLRLPRKSPVYQCISGHILCKECHQRCEDTCPTCRRPLHGKIRSIVADKLLDLMPVLCKYNDYGCEVETHRDKIDDHESGCDCRPVCCVDIACHSKVPMKRMIHHMETEHEREDFVHANGPRYRSHFIVNPDDFTREIMWISDHLTLDGHHFFRECCRTDKGIWFVWVYFLGPPEESENYMTSIRVRQQDDSEELIYKGRVNPLNSEVRSELTACSALVFPDSVAKQFTRDRKLYYVVEVERRPPKKTPIKMAEGGKRRKSRAAPAPTAVAAAVDEEAEHKNESSGSGGRGENDDSGDDVRETSC